MTRLFIALLFLIYACVLFNACTDIQSEPRKTETTPKTPEEPVTDDELTAYLEKFEQNFLEGLKEKKIPGGAVVLVKDGQVIYQKGFGVKEAGTSDPVDERTVFRLGSVSKGFASVLTGILVENGVLEWDEPVSSYLEEFKLNDPAQTERVQIKHLLSHTTGLPRHAYTNLVEDGLSLDRIIPRLKEVPLISKEGEQIAYQNAAYSAIEKVIETRTADDFKTLLRNALFGPLDMEHASASYDSIRTTVNKALPHVYYSRSRGRVPISISKKYYNAVSSGGINASASDMGKWLLLLTGNTPDFISPETLEQIYKPIATINNRRYSRYWPGVNRSHYAMGWRVLDNHGQKIVYHGGYVNGYRSEIAFAPEEGIGICVLINSNSGFPLEVIPGFFENFRESGNMK
ncbi:serine hydrolase domain-containing protein [Balneola sp. MJW-20]|uniref:serine hydrolase domain-containing protein n=1 Tax=Gracilimonas aurantiaca TaxID=3234185 RepID=UPI0034663229